jgi:hypothetical protein
MCKTRAACVRETLVTAVGVSVSTPRLHITFFARQMVNLISAFIDMHISKPLNTSARCILVTGSLQECLRGCGV